MTRTFMPTVYLAARYSRRDELRGYRDELHSMGWCVTSRWLDGDRLTDTAERAIFAGECWTDLTRAGIFVAFTEAPPAESSRGGRDVEFGAALAMGARCLLVGPPVNVFHFLPQVESFPTWTGAGAELNRSNAHLLVRR